MNHLEQRVRVPIDADNPALRRIENLCINNFCRRAF